MHFCFISCSREWYWSWDYCHKVLRPRRHVCWYAVIKVSDLICLLLFHNGPLCREVHMRVACFLELFFRSLSFSLRVANFFPMRLPTLACSASTWARVSRQGPHVIYILPVQNNWCSWKPRVSLSTTDRLRGLGYVLHESSTCCWCHCPTPRGEGFPWSTTLVQEVLLLLGIFLRLLQCASEFILRRNISSSLFPVGLPDDGTVKKVVGGYTDQSPCVPCLLPSMTTQEEEKHRWLVQVLMPWLMPFSCHGSESYCVLLMYIFISQLCWVHQKVNRH
jgi:hypothetical protein